MITIRFATLRDAKDISEVLAAAFIDNEVQGEYLFPRRLEYPEDYRLQFERMARTHMMRSRYRVLVAIDQATSRIVGFASWERQGPAGIAQLPHDTLLQIFTRMAVQCWDYVSVLVRPDRSHDAEHQAVFNMAVEDIKHHWSGSRQETWFLANMAVHPDAQGQGAGRALVLEGVRWGREDGVCASVVSSAIADTFYDKLGFVNVGSATEGALKGVRGGKIKFFEAHLSQGKS